MSFNREPEILSQTRNFGRTGNANNGGGLNALLSKHGNQGNRSGKRSANLSFLKNFGSGGVPTETANPMEISHVLGSAVSANDGDEDIVVDSGGR